MEIVKTLRLRVKDRHAKRLLRMAREVNMVWNYCNDISYRSIKDKHEYLSGYDLQTYTKGLSKCEGIQIGSKTIQQVCEEYAIRRHQFKKTRLRWRVSNRTNSKYSLGWIPFKKDAAKWKDGGIKFCGIVFQVWDSYDLAQYELRAGSFSEDARGRWYLNIQVKTNTERSEGRESIGIDLGWKQAAVCSDGEMLDSRWYRSMEKQLGTSQRAKKKTRSQAIHAKIKNKRKNELHQFSTKIVKRNAAIFVGNISSQSMLKRNGKSTLDAGWGILKTMLKYKCHWAGVVFDVVDERNTTQTCSSCGEKPDSRPKGIAGLGIREWSCSKCGAWHDRDINAAKNILALGHGRLAGGIAVL